MLPVHPFQFILVRWFLECRRSLLPSPVWPRPICLDSWTWHYRFLCNIALYSIRPCFYHQSHPQLGSAFALAPSLHFFLELFIHWYSAAYWAPTNLGNSSFSALSFWLFILFVMPKSQNLPMTTRELISDAKAREFLLPSSSWGSHHYWRSG